jgi:adenylate cyclase class 2
MKEMGLEIEVKAYAEDLVQVEQRLSEMGAVFVGTVSEDDLYVAHPCRDFRETDEALRVRVMDNRSFMTYKGRRIDDKSKTREEIEVALDDAENAKLLLVKLGFTPVATVIKVRKLYRLGECEICLDDVEGLGTFVEVETKGGDVIESRDRALALLERLNLRKTERRSYLKLLLATTS